MKPFWRGVKTGHGLLATLCCAALLLWPGWTACAQGSPASPTTEPLPASIPTATVPDVQIVVVPNPLNYTQWVVTAAYPKVVDRTAAVARATQLLALGGWKGSRPEVKNSALQTRYRMSGVPNAAPPMTSVTFTTDGMIVDPRSGTLALEPFIRAYHDLSRLQVLFLVPGPFTYQGPRSFTDANVDLSLAGGRGAFMVVVDVKDHSLRTLHLPRTEAERVEAVRVAAAARQQPARAAGIFIVVLLAFVAAVAAYLGVRQWAQRGERLDA